MNNKYQNDIIIYKIGHVATRMSKIGHVTTRMSNQPNLRIPMLDCGPELRKI